jgi:hypothetical protein
MAAMPKLSMVAQITSQSESNGDSHSDAIGCVTTHFRNARIYVLGDSVLALSGLSMRRRLLF